MLLAIFKSLFNLCCDVHHDSTTSQEKYHLHKKSFRTNIFWKCSAISDIDSWNKMISQMGTILKDLKQANLNRHWLLSLSKFNDIYWILLILCKCMNGYCCFSVNPILFIHINATRKLDIFSQDKGNSSRFGSAFGKLSSDNLISKNLKLRVTGLPSKQNFRLDIYVSR